MANLQDRVEQLIRLEGQALGVLRTIQEGIASIASNVKNLKGGGSTGPKEEKGKGLFTQLKGALGTVTKGLAIVTAVAGAVAAALLAVPLAVLGIVNASEKYVAALNPALVEQYDQEVRNLRATIGFGLTPVIAYATKSVKEWAGIVLDAARAVRPVLERLSAATSGAASGVVRFLVAIVVRTANALGQVVDKLEGTIEAFGALFEIASAVVTALDALDAVVFGALGGLVTLGDTFRQVATWIAVAAAKLVGALGGAEALGRFRKALQDAVESRKNPKKGLLAAPTDSSVTGFEDIAKQMSAKAFAATSGAPAKKSETDLLQQILDATEGIEPQTLSQIITEAVVEGFRQAKQGLNDAGDRVRERIDAIRNPDFSTSARAALGVFDAISPGGGFVFGGGG